MRTKKIIADSMPLALKMVRQQLGENAIIVNTRMVKMGGMFGVFSKKKYEVTAYSVDKQNQTAEPKYVLERKDKPFPIKTQTDPPGENHGSGFHTKPQNLYSYYSKQAEGTETHEEEQNVIPEGKIEAVLANSEFQPIFTTEAANNQTSAQAAAALEKNTVDAPDKKSPVDKEDVLLDELQHMRKMMMSWMMNDRQSSSHPASIAKWVNRLKKQGVEEEVAAHIINELLKKVDSVEEADGAVIKKELKEIVADLITKRVPKTNSVSEGVRMINIIGPTGVGKTTSIAKLATEQVLKQKRRVAMITTDVYRIAAVEQLKTYAGILNVPFEVVRSAEELGRVLENLKHYDLIYMDTTGRNYKELEYRNSINGYLNQTLESDNYLVLSLTTKYEDMERLLDEFLGSPIKKLILTKFDETTSFGSIVNIAYKYPYEIVYLTNGQSVPEDIMALDAAMISSYLLGEEN